MIIGLQSMETRPQNAEDVLSFVYFVGCGCLLLICFSRRKSQTCSLLNLSMRSSSSWESSNQNALVNNQSMHAAGKLMEARTYLEIPSPQLHWIHLRCCECDLGRYASLPVQQVRLPPLEYPWRRQSSLGRRS